MQHVCSSEELCCLQDALHRLLTDAMLQAHSYPAANCQLPGKLVQVRYVVLKNLAILLAKRQATAAKALDLFTEAAMIDGSDVLVWNHFSSLVCPLESACSMCAVTRLMRRIAGYSRAYTAHVFEQ